MNTALVLIGLMMSAAGAQDAPPAPAAGQPDRREDETAIRAIVEASMKAYDAGDAAAYAALYTDDAVLITEDGTRLEGRAAIADEFACLFAENPGDTLRLKTKTLTFLDADTAEEEGVATVTPASTPDTPQVTRYTVLYAKRDGKWLQVRERDDPDRSLTPHDRLKALEWMVGDWVNESSQAVVATSCKWSDNGNFLLREFTVKVAGQPVMSGSQRIGWDALTGQFKSWVFDTEGGHGEGAWTQNGNQWMIKATGVRPDGKIATATQILTRLGRDRVGWKSQDRTLGGEAVPDIEEFTLVRKPPEPSLPATPATDARPASAPADASK
mgnify:CR=1 FL=1